MGHHPVTHFEFTAKESKKLQDFYGGVFGWKLNDAPQGYKMVDTDSNGHGIGGGIGQSRDGKGMLTVYIEADDLKGTLAKVEKAGGRTIMPPQQAGPVEVALFADPEGNIVGLAKGM
jgi:predicted enzyme related to lactoylglutathione lyase